MRRIEDPERAGIAKGSLELGPQAVRGLFDNKAIEAVEIQRPPLEELPYHPFVRALLRAPGLKLDFGGQPPDAVLSMVADRLFGPGSYAGERALLARDIAELSNFAQGMVAGARPLVAIRTYFAPGDLVWHVDRLNEPTAFRLLWPLGRPAGMKITPAENIDAHVYRAFMRREFPLLCQLDTRVLRTGASVESLWAHRPAQLAAMTSARFPFIVDAEKEWEIEPSAVSVHRVETPVRPGTYHRSSWANRMSPGLQVVITAAADQP